MSASPPGNLAGADGGARASGQGRTGLGRRRQTLVTLSATLALPFVAQVAPPGDRALVYLNTFARPGGERTGGELAPANAEFSLDRPLPGPYADYAQRGWR